MIRKWLSAGVERRIRRSTKQRSGSVENVRRDSVATASEDAASRRLIIRASVGSEDRAGDVINPKGWLLDGFRSNPVFLWAHDRSTPPIGRAARTWVDRNSLLAVIEFAPTEFANQIADLYEKGFMRGVSVGFIPIETEVRESSYGRRALHFVQQELLEISAVPVPMHTGTLAEVPRVPQAAAFDQQREVGELLREVRHELSELQQTALELAA